MFLIHFQDKMLLGNKQPNLKHFFVSNEFGQIADGRSYLSRPVEKVRVIGHSRLVDHPYPTRPFPATTLFIYDFETANESGKFSEDTSSCGFLHIYCTFCKLAHRSISVT